MKQLHLILLSFAFISTGASFAAEGFVKKL